MKRHYRLFQLNAIQEAVRCSEPALCNPCFPEQATGVSAKRTLRVGGACPQDLRLWRALCAYPEGGSPPGMQTAVGIVGVGGNHDKTGQPSTKLTR